MSPFIMLPANKPVPSQTFFFDTSVQPGDWSYTNSNRTVQRTTNSPWRSALLDPAYTKSSGKWYLEFLYTSRNGPFSGFYGQTTAETGSSFMGSTALGWSHNGSDASGSPSSQGRLWTNGGPTVDPYGFAWELTPKVLMIASDLDNGDIWFGVDGVWTVGSDPATATNPAFTGVSTTGTRWGVSGFYLNDSFTIPTTLSYPIPTGYSVLV